MGDEPSRLLGLLDLLRSTYGAGAKITAAEIEPFLGDDGGVPPWDLTDAIDRGDRAVALELLQRMIGQGDRHPFQVLGTLHSHFARMLRLDGAEVAGEKEAAELLGLKGSTFPAKKALGQARRLGHDRIVRAIDLLAEADLDLRGGKAWPDHLVLEVLVARLPTIADRADAGRPDRGSARRAAELSRRCWPLSFLASRLLRRAAAFLWITPLAAAVSMRFWAIRASSSAFVGALGGRGGGVLGAGLHLAADGLVALGALDRLPVALDLALDVRQRGFLHSLGIRTRRGYSSAGGFSSHLGISASGHR